MATFFGILLLLGSFAFGAWIAPMLLMSIIGMASSGGYKEWQKIIASIICIVITILPVIGVITAMWLILFK